MDLSHLSRERLEELIRNAYDEHTLNALLIDAVRSSAEFKEAVDIYHSLVCNEDHDSEDSCSYYIEDHMPSIWKEPAHMKYAQALLDLCPDMSPSEIRNIIHWVVNIQKILPVGSHNRNITLKILSQTTLFTG